jgi:hypothetical protein
MLIVKSVKLTYINYFLFNIKDLALKIICRNNSKIILNN